MKVGDSVRKAIADFEMGEVEAAMLHACNALDGTAKKLHPHSKNKARFTQTLRDHYFILGPMGAPGCDLVRTRFPVVVQGPTTADKVPDIADVIYGIHRCSHGHGDELPDGFELFSDVNGPAGLSHMGIETGVVKLSDRIIFGMLTIAVLSPVNKDQRVPDGYWLSYGLSTKLMINDWWGRLDDFHVVIASEPAVPAITFDLASWMPTS